MTIKCVTLDLDDTLWDCAPVIEAAEATFYEWLSENYPELSFECLPGVPLTKSPLGLIRFCIGLIGSFFYSLRFFRRVGADALFGFGGFTMVGHVLAAKVRGIPVFLHEANRAVGRSIRVM